MVTEGSGVATTERSLIVKLYWPSVGMAAVASASLMRSGRGECWVLFGAAINLRSGRVSNHIGARRKDSDAPAYCGVIKAKEVRGGAAKPLTVKLVGVHSEPDAR